MKIKRALLSVSDKTGIVELGKFLSEKGVEIISTGGTMKSLREAGVPVTYVSDVTGFPEIMDGVKKGSRGLHVRLADIQMEDLPALGLRRHHVGAELTDGR